MELSLLKLKYIINIMGIFMLYYVYKIIMIFNTMFYLSYYPPFSVMNFTVVGKLKFVMFIML